MQQAHEAPITMIVPLLILSLGAIFYGFFTRDLIIGLGSLFFNNVHTGVHHFDIVDSEFLDSLIKNIPFIFTCLGACLSLFLINCFGIEKRVVYQYKQTAIAKMFYIFLNKKWHFDQIVNEFIVAKTMNYAYYITFQSIDKGLIERVGPTGFTASALQSSKLLVNYYSGSLYHTILAIVSFVFLFTSYFLVGYTGLITAISVPFTLLLFSFLIKSLINI
jgi:NADH:ubiquinone oxidoreductase subunit 5 (subunit L)/multisubunit Na+/H+ antiporter MnhA subunit